MITEYACVIYRSKISNEFLFHIKLEIQFIKKHKKLGNIKTRELYFAYNLQKKKVPVTAQ